MEKFYEKMKKWMKYRGTGEMYKKETDLKRLEKERQRMLLGEERRGRCREDARIGLDWIGTLAKKDARERERERKNDVITDQRVAR